MSSFPPEIIALIVEDIAHSEKATFVSGLILAWPDSLPFVREHRFKEVKISSPERLESFISISSPEVMTAVRKITFSCGHPSPLETSRLVKLVSTAVNMEEIRLSSFTMDSAFDLPASLGVCPRLTTISLYHVSSHRLSTILHALQLLPHLTTLKFGSSRIKELEDIAFRLSNSGPSDSHPPWDTHKFVAPSMVAQLACLELDLYGISDLLFLDLVSSSKTPFPNVGRIRIASYNSLPFRPCRLPALLRRYRTSLRVFEIGSSIVSAVSSFTLPPTLSSFKFGVGFATHLHPYCKALSSGKGTLTTVTVRVNSMDLGFPEGMARLDAVLAGLDLETLGVEGDSSRWTQLRAFVEMHLPVCLGRYISGGIVGGTYVLRGV